MKINSFSSEAFRLFDMAGRWITPVHPDEIYNLKAKNVLPLLY